MVFFVIMILAVDFRKYLKYFLHTIQQGQQVTELTGVLLKYTMSISN